MKRENPFEIIKKYVDERKVGMTSEEGTQERLTIQEDISVEGVLGNDIKKIIEAYRKYQDAHQWLEKLAKLYATYVKICTTWDNDKSIDTTDLMKRRMKLRKMFVVSEEDMFEELRNKDKFFIRGVFEGISSDDMLQMSNRRRDLLNSLSFDAIETDHTTGRLE